MQLFTKEELIQKLQQLAEMGWVKSGRFGNHGGIGNTLEDYLGIQENNLPIPNATEWELKAQNIKTNSLTTLFHTEPSPRAVGFIPRLLLPYYGWPHKEAGNAHPADEMSFRQTINALNYSDRGFKVVIDRDAEKITVSFDANKVSSKHSAWLDGVAKKIGLGELNPQPYWGFKDIEHIAGTKLLNCFYVQAKTKRQNGETYYWYNKVQVLSGFKLEMLLHALEDGILLVDFDARTRHNHGTKFRARKKSFPSFYEHVTTVIDLNT